MFQSLLHITPETAKLAELVCAVSTVEKLFLLGSTEVYKHTTSVFHREQPPARHPSHYYLLVLVNNTDDHTHTCLQDKIENHLQHFIPVTAIILCTEQFNNWLDEGHPFANRVVQNAMLLHDNGEPLHEANALNEEELKAGMQCYYTKGLNLLQEFLAGAEMYRIRKQHAMAAFMLHQSAEHGLRTLMKITTGLKTNTHNLERLTRYCSMAVPGVMEIFSKEQPRSKNLFTKLQHAYIDARYKDYSISCDDLLQLEQQIRSFIELYKRYNR